MDESGDHGLKHIDPASPVFVLCAALFKIEDYLHVDTPALTKIKFDLWHHDNVVFHSYSIRKRVRPFEALRNSKNQEVFYDRIAKFFEASTVTLVAAAVHKQRHKDQYVDPAHPYALTVQFVLERIYGHVKARGGADTETVCIFESRGKKEDAEVEQWFKQTTEGNQWARKLPFRAQFASKRTNMAGLQIADLAAYPITQYVANPAKARKDWEAIEPRIRRSPTGETRGWGLKIFP